MARARNIKPGFFTNDQIGELEPLARLLFIGLWCIADREGRLEDRPKKIRAEVLPYDDCDAEKLLSDIASHGFIVRYESEKRPCIQIVNFTKHQSPHIKEQASSLPAPDMHQTCTEVATLIVGCGLLIADSGLSDPGLLIADTPLPSKPSQSPAAKKPRQSSAPLSDERQAQARAAWQGYADAYRQRYGEPPVRNKRVNSQVRQLLERLPAGEAPYVAAYFLRNSSSFYVLKGHAFGLLLADAEKLRTEWATGRVITQTAARQADRTEQTGQTFGKLIEEKRNGTEG